MTPGWGEESSVTDAPNTAPAQSNPDASDRASWSARRDRRSGFVRRRLLPIIGRFAVFGALLLVAAWVAGRVLNDSRHWSQYLWWLPTGLVALAAWLGFVVSAIAEKLGTRLAGAVVRPFALLAAVGVTLWLGLVEWRAYRFLYGHPPPPDVTVVYWNMAAASSKGAAPLLESLIERAEADVVIYANPRADGSSGELAEVARAFAASGDDDEAVPPAGPAVSLSAAGQRRLVRFVGTTIASRYPVIASGSAGLRGIDGSWFWRPSETGVEGIGFVTLDATETLGRVLTLWVVDLPSNAAVHRSEIMRAARQAASDWRRVGGAPETEMIGFPKPDVIIGDFNTPAGSDSIGLLVGDARNAYDAVGSGPRATWPRAWPQLAIDLAYVDPAHDIRSWRRLDPGLGHHHAIAVGISAKGGAAAQESDAGADAVTGEPSSD